MNSGKFSNVTWLWPALVAMVFIIAKMPAMQLPYFWDELGVYARAGLYLHDHGVGLLPAVLPPELSRGHPLLFSFIHGLGYQIFGDSVLGGHITGLLIALALVLSVYYISNVHFNQKTALLAMMLTIAQPVFFAQSILVLPEVCLALLMLWSLHYWAKKKYGWFAMFATMAILVKETAIIIPVVVASADIIVWLVRRNKYPVGGLKWQQLFLITPFVIFGIFLLIQKQQNGWYFFPLHQDNVEIAIPKLLNFGGDFLSFSFLEQGRIVLSVTAGLLLIYLGFKKQIKWNAFSIYLLMLFVGGVLFSSFNFFMNRYLLFAIIPLVIVLSALLVKAAEQFKPFLLLVPILFVVGLISMNGYELYPVTNHNMTKEQQFHYDEDMSYVYYLDAQQQAVDFLLTDSKLEDSLFANFPLVLAFGETRYGFTEKQNLVDYTLQIKRARQVGFKYAAIANPGAYDHVLPAPDSLQTVKTIGNKVVEINIYAPLKP